MKRLIVLLLVATLPVASAAAAQKPKLTGYAPYDAEGFCAPVGLTVFVSGQIKGATAKEANAVRKKYAPRGKATLTVGGGTYSLTPDRKLDGASKGFASWGFKTLKLPTSTGKALVGQRGTVAYDTKGGDLSVKVKVTTATCG